MAMTFKTNLLPDQDLVRELGSSTQKWKINGVTDPKLTDTVTTVTTSGSGNAITAISASNGAITATKGTTFLTSHQDISGKVNKSGDTMTGSLQLQDNSSLVIKTSNIDLTSAPSENAYGTNCITLKDNQNNRVAFIRANQTTANSSSLEIQSARTFDSGNIYNGFNLYVNADKTCAVTVTQPDAWCTGIGAVKKSGDTMTGNLTVTNTAPEIIAKSSISNIATSISTSSDGKSHGLWSYGYSSNGTSLTSDGKWMIYRDGNGNIIVNGKSTENVLKSGDTMTDNLFVKKSIAPSIGVVDSNNNLSVKLHVGTGHQNHGLYSTGYATDDNLANNTYTNDEKWMVYRDKNGNVVVNGKSTENVLKSGDTMTGSLTINKTGAMPLNIGPYGGAYGTSGTGQIWYCGTNATATNYIKDTIYIGSTGNQNLKAATMYTNIVQVNTGTNPDGNTQGHGVKIWHDAEGGNIGIYAGKSNQTDNYYYEIDAPSGLLRVSVLKNGAYLSTPCYISPTQGLFGAVWNDYAEFRKDNEKEKDIQQPGRCIKENGDGTLSLTTRRLERGCEIISDTFGFSIGQDKENGCNTPIASSGRVLAYPYESIEEFTNHIGWPVCSGPNGTVSIMTEEEEEKYPSRIIGTISEIPSYEEWGTGKVKVNGRIWIRIK